MKAFILTLALLSLPFSAQASEMTPISDMPAGEYEVDKTHASLIWKVSHMGLADYTARFNTFDATITLDPDDLTQSKVTASISPLSLETDYPNPEEEDFDKKLATGEDWLNADAFPIITFESTGIEITGENTGKVTGDLMLLGTKKPVVLDVTFNGAYAEKPMSKTPALGFSGITTIKRSEWGFDTYVPMIGDEVDVIIEAEFHKKEVATEE